MSVSKPLLLPVDDGQLISNALSREFDVITTPTHNLCQQLLYQPHHAPGTAIGFLAKPYPLGHLLAQLKQALAFCNFDACPADGDKASALTGQSLQMQHLRLQIFQGADFVGERLHRSCLATIARQHLAGHAAAVH